MGTAVVGHVEWAEFAAVPAVPAASDVVHARSWWAVPGGGGAVAAVQLARLGGSCDLLTAVGDDALGRRTIEALEALGVSVHAAVRDVVTRRQFVHVDDGGERTITVLGDRLAPERADALPWEELARADAVYFTAGDRAALEAARSARVLVVTPRARDPLWDADVRVDVLVHSGSDPSERFEPDRLRHPPRVVVTTLGARGGRWIAEDGTAGIWEAAPPPGPPADAYGCGDSFAAALTHGLGAGLPLADAVALGARAGAACLTGRGPYEAQLRA
jgi:ribokinase